MDEKDFSETSDREITEAIRGKVIDHYADEGRMDSFIVLYFTDGTSLRIRYDYIYSWNLTEKK